MANRSYQGHVSAIAKSAADACQTVYMVNGDLAVLTTSSNALHWDHGASEQAPANSAAASESQVKHTTRVQALSDSHATPGA